MIKNKKLLAIVCTIAMIASLFVSFGAFAAAEVPASSIAIKYNTEDSTDLKLVFDITTTAQYVAAGSITVDVSNVWDLIEGTTAVQKRNTLKNNAIAGDAMEDMVNNGGSCTFAGLTSKKFKISITAVDSSTPADFVTYGDLVAQLVIPLTSKLETAATFALGEDTYLECGVVDEEDENTGFSYMQQYVSDNQMTISEPATVGSTATPEPTATPTAEPTATPTAEPTATPTAEPTATPTAEPTATPTAEPADKVTVDETATAVADDTAYWGVKILEAAEANITAKFETDTESKEVTLVNAAGLDGNGDLAFNLYLKLTGERVGKKVTATVTVGEDSDSGVWAAAN